MPPISAEGVGAADPPTGRLVPVPVIRQRAEWNRFIILVWQFKHDVREDEALYDAAGLHGFHIDRGKDEEDRVRFSLRRGFPYYVDHAAGKGILYLHKEVQPTVSGRAALQARPHSLADPATIATLKGWLRENVATTSKGLVYAYGFDDEISTGTFNNPVEVDFHPLSVAWYRKWLAARYGDVQRLNAAWETRYASFDAVAPSSFEDVRARATRPPLASWNLSR